MAEPYPHPDTTDAGRRRNAPSFPGLPSIFMTIDLAVMLTLLVCAWLFGAVPPEQLLTPAAIGLGVPLSALCALSYFAASKRELRAYTQTQHEARKAELAAFRAEVFAALTAIRALLPPDGRQLDEITGCMDDLTERVDALESNHEIPTAVGIFRPRPRS